MGISREQQGDTKGVGTALIQYTDSLGMIWEY